VVAARVRNDLGVLFKYTGRFDEAAELYEAALQVQAMRSRARTPGVATVLHNIGGLAHAAGRPAEGEAPAREALAIRRKALGFDHPDTAAEAAALAGILIALDRDDERKCCYRRPSPYSCAASALRTLKWASPSAASGLSTPSAAGCLRLRSAFDKPYESKSTG
jgi:tetratricopeptide (TPR) repeat protein